MTAGGTLAPAEEARMGKRVTRWGNRIGVWWYRRFDGRYMAPKGIRVMMLTIPGRRTGQSRPACMRCLEHDGAYLVWGSGSGSRTEPDWFANLRATETVEAQLGQEHLQLHREVLDGDERDRVWRDVVLAQAPGVEKYERKAGRTIPVARLTRGLRGSSS